MNLLCGALVALGVSSGCGQAASGDPARVQQQSTVPGGISLEAEIALPSISGRLGHLALDRDRARLYVCAEENGTLEVVDLESKRLGRTIGGFQSPRAVLFLSELERVVVSNAQAGTLIVLDARSYKRLETVDVGAGVSELAFDAQKNLLYAALGDKAIAIVDATTWKSAGKIDLPAAADALGLDAKSARLFAGLGASGAIEVLDTTTSGSRAHWKGDEFGADGPLLLVDEGKRLLACSSTPPKLALFDSQTGVSLGGAELAGACRDLAYDAPTRRLFVPCANGVLEVFTRVEGEHFTLATSLGTGAGATTCLFDRPSHRLYVAVPASTEPGQPPKAARVLSFEDLP